MHASPLITAHESRGARLQGGSAPRVLTFGDVPAEYEAATRGCALFDETDRGRLTVTGGDAAEFLHRLLANDVRGVEAGCGNKTLLLTPKGKILFEADLSRSGETFELSTPTGEAAKLLTALDMYLFADDVELTESTESHAPLSIAGPQAEECLAKLVAGALPAEIHQRSELDWNGTELAITRAVVAGSPGFILDAGPEHVAELWNALEATGAVPCGVIVRDILRIEAGAAQFGDDIDENIYPQEARLEPAFSLDKGCYIGQEVVAKIDTYGGLNKRLVALKLEHDDPIPRGTPVVKLEDGEERELGLVTSWAYSFVLDTGLVLAYLKKRHQDVGMEFQVAGARAEIVALPVRTGCALGT